jgi:hypothetical protein
MLSANPLLALTVPPLLTVSWPAIRATPTIVPPLDTVAFRLVPPATICSVIPLLTAKLLSVKPEPTTSVAPEPSLNEPLPPRRNSSVPPLPTLTVLVVDPPESTSTVTPLPALKLPSVKPAPASSGPGPTWYCRPALIVRPMSVPWANTIAVPRLLTVTLSPSPPEEVMAELKPLPTVWVPPLSMVVLTALPPAPTV